MRFDAAVTLQLSVARVLFSAGKHRDAEAIAQLQRIQHGYVAASDRLHLPEWRARPQVQRLLENTARIMSPLL